MKKTVKRSLILLSLITALLVCTLAFTASAEEKPVCMEANGSHSAAFLYEIEYAPTCTQKGFVRTLCRECGAVIVDHDYTLNETGHSYEVSYNKVGDHYDRILTCTNPLCHRAENADDKDIKNMSVKSFDFYYSVEFKNACESPAADAEDHAEYFNSDYYVASDRSTWLAEKFTTKEYISSTKTNADAKKSRPAYEYIEMDGKIRLFVRSGEYAPEYAGDVRPTRMKDAGLDVNGNKPIGKYVFNDWIAESAPMKYDAHLTGDITSYKDVAITKNTTFYAYFAGDEKVTVTIVFYDGDRSALSTGLIIPYGSTINYKDYGLKVPTKTSDEKCYYTYNGWTLGENKKTVYGIDDPITLYSNTGAYAHFAESANEYTVRFVNNAGEKFTTKDENDNDIELGVSEKVTYGSRVEGLNTILDLKGALDVPMDKKFMYHFTNTWTLKQLNGEEAYGSYTINPENFNIPCKVTVLGSDGNVKEVAVKTGDEVVLAPVYSRQYIVYYIPINIITVRFEEEDLFDDNSMIRNDILDDFVIQVTDAKGQFVGGGMTDKNGQFILATTYSDTLKITAKTATNSKYYGEHTLELRYCSTHEEIKSYEEHGVAIAPSVTQEWLDGILAPCSCMCHGILSPILIRIYNILFRLFNYKYVCCDDLFVTHGSILAYTK